MILDNEQVKELASCLHGNAIIRISGYALRNGVDTPFNVAISFHGTEKAEAPAALFEARLDNALRTLHRALVENKAREDALPGV